MADLSSRLRSQVAKAADCKSAIVGSTPTGASFFSDTGKPPETAVFSGHAGKPGVSGTTFGARKTTPRNLIYAKEAVTRGQLIAERDHVVTASFAMHVLSMYATLQEARREVLRAYAA